MRGAIVMAVLGLSASARAWPGGTADLTMQASYANVGSPPAIDGLEHSMTVGLSLRGALGNRFLYECAGLDLEVGGGIPGSLVYDTNLYLLGVGLRFGEISALKVCAGGGLSGVADRVGFSLQAPVEASMVIQIGSRVRLHGWARGAWLSSDRRHDGSDALPSLDELSTGVGLGWTKLESFRGENAESSGGYFVAFRYSELLGAKTYGLAIGYRLDGAADSQ